MIAAQQQQRAVLSWMLKNMEPAGSQMSLLQLQEQQLLFTAAAAAALKSRNVIKDQQTIFNNANSQNLMTKLLAGVAQQQQNPSTAFTQQLLITHLQKQFVQQLNASNTSILTKENTEKVDEDPTLIEQQSTPATTDSKELTISTTAINTTSC